MAVSGGIKQVKVRASVKVGGATVVTPYILSFSVNLARGQVGTCSAKLKMSGSQIESISSGSSTAIQVKAGADLASNTIFSGEVTGMGINPCWDDPLYTIVDITAQDWLSLLQGKKYTRRVTAQRSSWVSIDSVTRKGLRDGKFKAKSAGKIYTVHSDFLGESSLIDAVPLSDPYKMSMTSAPESTAPLPGAGVAKIKSD